MILYIPLEVHTREIKGHLLLASIAVSRGYQVLIGSPSDLWMYKRLNLLPRGNYLLKNMNIPSHSESQYKSYIKAGFDLYCHEQEPSIIYSQFEDFIEIMKIDTNQYLPFKAVFCWGERGKIGYQKIFPLNKNIFFNTGSPRSDLWSDKFLPLRSKNIKKSKRPYILFVLNFGILMGKKHMSWQIDNLVNLDLIKNDSDFYKFINSFKEENIIGYETIKAIKHVASNFPNYDVILRPHPVSKIENWKSLFNDVTNITVTSNRDSLSEWISNSCVVIHNGCTSAIESVIQNIPIICYGPIRKSARANLPNDLGFRATDLIELEEKINYVLENENEYKNPAESKELLRDIISTETQNSANLFIDIINDNSIFNSKIEITFFNIIKLFLVKRLKTSVDFLRKLLGNHNLKDVDYKINNNEVTQDVESICKILNINSPKIKFISNTSIFLKN